MMPVQPRWFGALLLPIFGALLAFVSPVEAQLNLSPPHAVPRLRSLNGSANRVDQALAVVTDAQNNVITFGFVEQADTFWDWAVRKYSSSGAVLWTTILRDTALRGAGIPHSLGIDAQGNTFIAGSLENETTGDDFAVAKCAPDGKVL